MTPSSITVTSFKNCQPALQEEVATALFYEWKTDFAVQGVHDPEACLQSFIKNYGTWEKDKTCFYVFQDPLNSVFLGAVSMQYDMKSPFAPAIANVFVHPTARKCGFGTLMIQFAERFLRRKSMRGCYIWCDPHLVPFYEKRGYKVVDSPNGSYKEIIIMGKSL